MNKRDENKYNRMYADGDQHELGDFRDARASDDAARKFNSRYEWHPWFAWYPVPLVGEVLEGPGTDVSYSAIGRHAWLRWVECRVEGAVVSDEQSARDAGDLTEYWLYRLPVTASPMSGRAEK